MEPRAHAGLDIFLAIGGIDTVDADIMARRTAGPRFECIHNTLPGGRLFTDRYRVFQIENHRICAHLKNLFYPSGVIGRGEQEAPDRVEFRITHTIDSKTSGRSSASRE